MFVAVDKLISLYSGWINEGAITLRILALKRSCPVVLLTEILPMTGKGTAKGAVAQLFLAEL